MSAILSPCGNYRYRLSRQVSTAGLGECRRLLFIMLNPSTADAQLDDPTIRKCKGFATRAYHGQLDVVNLFAYRATDPAAMKAAGDPVGPENRRALVTAASESDMIVCAWGTHGAFKGQDKEVLRWLRHYDLYALELTKDGHPKHPLYISYDKEPFLWKAAQND